MQIPAVDNTLVGISSDLALLILFRIRGELPDCRLQVDFKCSTIILLSLQENQRQLIILPWHIIGNGINFGVLPVLDTKSSPHCGGLVTRYCINMWSLLSVVMSLFIDG
jgi:hypothetical protein